jgi:hypothetical protein
MVPSLSLKARILLLYLDIFLSDSRCASQRQQRTLVIALVIQKPRLTLSARVVCQFYLTRLDHTSLPFLPYLRLVTYHP